MTKSTGVGRGGARAGAGRKRVDVDQGEIVWRYAVSVHQTAHDIIEELGNGNASLGVRRMANELHAYRTGQIQHGGHSARITTNRAAAGASKNVVLVTATRPPALEEVSERDAGGNKRNVTTMIRLRREAQERFDMRMAQYRAELLKGE